MPTYKETQYIVIRESILQSIITDTFTFGVLLALWFVNHCVLGGSGTVDLCIWISVVLSALAKATSQQKKMTAAEAIEYLQGQKKPRFKVIYHIANLDGRIIESFTTYDDATARLKSHPNAQIRIGTERVS